MRTLTITIIGISAISILIDVLLPDGKTSKYIKGIYSVLTMVIILSNVVNIYKGGINFDKFFGDPSTGYEQNDADAIKIIESRYAERSQNAIKTLAERGIVVTEIRVELADEKPYGVKYADVYVGQMVEGKEEEIKNTVSVIMICKKESIRVYVQG